MWKKIYPKNFEIKSSQKMTHMFHAKCETKENRNDKQYKCINIQKYSKSIV